MKIRIKPFQRMMTLLLTILGLLISSQDLGSEDGGSGGATCPDVCTVNWICKDAPYCDRWEPIFATPFFVISQLVCYNDKMGNYCLGGGSHEGRDHYCQGNWGCQGAGCSCKNGYCICH